MAPATAAASVEEALRQAAREIAAAGCESPRLDAELLLAKALGVARERLLLEPSRPLGRGELRALQALVRRRARLREPVAYITGRRAFRRLELAVDGRALIPRPESELLVEVGLRLPQGARVLDVGTGCGAIALALKQERPDLTLLATDTSAAALALARENARRLGLGVAFARADLTGGLRCDAVLANLPYVAERERPSLAPEILDHEPAQALFAGPDGLAQIRRLLAQLSLRGDVGLVALEVGAGQAGAVAKLVRGAGFGSARCERDLSGIQRVVIGVAPAA